MLINWVQGLLPRHKSAFLWFVPQQHACDPWLLGLPLKGKGESKEVGRGWGSLTEETEPRAESKVEETSVLHPSHVLHLSDAVLVNSPTHFSHFENFQGLVSTSKISLSSCECAGIPTSQEGELWISY